MKKALFNTIRNPFRIVLDDIIHGFYAVLKCHVGKFAMSGDKYNEASGIKHTDFLRQGYTGAGIVF